MNRRAAPIFRRASRCGWSLLAWAWLGCAGLTPNADSPTDDDARCDDACVQRQLGQVLAALDRGRVQEASDLLDDIRPRPEMNDPSLRLVLALLALERGETAQAAAHANWLAEHARGARIAASTCRVLVRLGEARRAATFAQQRINEGIASPSLHLELALAWEAMGQDDASYRALEDGLTAFPDDPALLETAAARADAAGNVDRAIELYTRAISHHSAPALMHEAIARVATDAGRLDIAIQHARAAVTLAGDQDPKVYRILYDALLASGDTDGARAALERGRRRFPQAPILGVP